MQGAALTVGRRTTSSQGLLAKGVRLARVLAGGTTTVLPRPRMSTLGPSRRVRHRSPVALADRLCVCSFIARKPFTAACTKISKFGVAADRHGTPGQAAGKWELFSEAQGEAARPRGCRFHLRLGQPLASESRSVADWGPFLGLMRFGHPRHVSRPRLAARAYLYIRPPDLPGIARGPAWKAA